MKHRLSKNHACPRGNRRLSTLLSLAKQLVVLCLFAAAAVAATAQSAASLAGTFHNPLLPSGPDPWVTQRDGFYYYMNTTGHNLTIRKTRDITDLSHAQKKIVWTPPATGPWSHEIWAPELHFLDGKWYIYFAADAGSNDSHRIYVLENDDADPLDGEWTFKGEVEDATNKWGIDPSVFEDKGQMYLIWSGWPDDVDGEQDIYIAHLKNPWTVDSKRVRLSQPTYPWERNGDLNRPLVPHVNINEGPEILEHQKDIFLVYSASACWTDDYELGVLQAKSGADLLDPHSWKKFDHPFFKQDRAAGVYATGHNGFFQSPDGKQDWIIYHANSEPGEGCGNRRSPRAQPFTWNADGTPNFGKPISTDTAIPKPSH
jgi:GH43 family beta-xylosidase